MVPSLTLPFRQKKATSWHDWTSRKGSDGQEDHKATPWYDAEPPTDTANVLQIQQGSVGAPSHKPPKVIIDFDKFPMDRLHPPYPVTSPNGWIDGIFKGCNKLYEWLAKHSTWKTPGDPLDTMALPGYSQPEIRAILSPYWPAHETDLTGQALRLRDLKWAELVSVMFDRGWW